MNKTVLIFSILVLLVLLAVGFVFFQSFSPNAIVFPTAATTTAPEITAAPVTTETEEETLPSITGNLWDVTWEEFEAMTPAEKEIFFDSFGSVEEFDQWMQEATREKAPWETGGKLPGEYTWEEYEALTPAQKEQFFDYFGSADAFDAWLQNAQDQIYLPWEDGGKQPWEYTWEEYEALTSAQKEAFFDAFGSAEDFDLWMRGAGGATEAPYPWEAGGKQPQEYTWAEYEALTPAQKDAFFDTFPSVEAFDAWMDAAVAASMEAPWENGGKQPEEYTWEEYESLSPAQKEMFFDAFESLEAFQAWMERVNPDA